MADGVGDGGDQGAADAALLVVRVDVEFGDDEGVVEPAVGPGGPQIGLDDGGPPLGAVVGQPVDEADEPSVGGGGAECAGVGVFEVSEDDVAAYVDLVLAQSEGRRLDAQGFVDAGGQVDGADLGVGCCGAFSGGCCHAGTLLAGAGGQNRAFRGVRVTVQNRTLMNAPTSRKPTRR